MSSLDAIFADLWSGLASAVQEDFQGLPGAEKRNLERQVYDTKEISSISRTSSLAKVGLENSGTEKPQARARRPAWAGARGSTTSSLEMLEILEKPLLAGVCPSSSLSRNLEKDRETGNSDPLPAAPDPDEVEERAAFLEYDGGLSRAEAEAETRQEVAARPAEPGPLLSSWRAGLARLRPHRIPCPGYRVGQWPAVYARAVAFLDTFGEQSEALGWTTPRLFGVHAEIGIIRTDVCGGLVLPIGGPVRAITAATISFGHLIHREKPGQPQGIPIWAFGR